MASNKRRKQDAIAKALGASRVLSMKSRWSGGPLDWLMLAQAVRSRLISRGGRPSDPNWNTKRLVPFRRQTWKRLASEAKMISASGRHVGPAQLAAIVIEQILTSAEINVPQIQIRFFVSNESPQLLKGYNSSFIVESGTRFQKDFMPETIARPYFSEQLAIEGS